jgi:ankyrin repeat protein
MKRNRAVLQICAHVSHGGQLRGPQLFRSSSATCSERPMWVWGELASLIYAFLNHTTPTYSPSIMAVPIVQDDYKEDGWSDSSDSSDSVSDITSSEDGLAVPIADLETSATDFDADAMYDHLRRRLEQAGVFPRGFKVQPDTPDTADDSTAPPIPSLPYPSLFPHIASSVVQGDLKSWIASESVWLRLRLPSGLDNPYFVTSLLTKLVTSQPTIRMIPTILRQDGVGVGGTECLLMSLCHQLLSDRQANWDFPELLGELKLAVFGLNRTWRTALLWALLQCLLTQGNNKSVLLILSLPFENNLERNLRSSSLDRLLQLMESTDRSIKLLLLVGHNLWETFDQVNETFMAKCRTMEIDMYDTAVKEGILADMLSHFAATLGTRAVLGESREVILSAILQQFREPLSVLSASHALSFRPWLSRQQLTAGSGFQCDTDSILARIPMEDRLFVVDVLGILWYCARPLTLLELAEALTAGHPLSLAEENKLLDLEFDLCHSLAGLVHVQDGIIWFFPSCAAYSSGQKQLSLGGTVAWLDMGQAAEMRLALRCLRYISLSSNAIESVQLGDEAALDKKRPFLNYAATFWHYHYTRAIDSGGPDGEIRNLFHSEPNVINIWLMLQGSFYSSNLMVAIEEKPSAAHELSPLAIAQDFGVQLDDAMKIVDIVSHKLLALGKDIHGARSFSSMDRENLKVDNPTPNQPRNAFAYCDSTSLAQAAVYLPEGAFKLVQADQDILRNNAMLLLQTAVRQGNSALVNDCLRHITLDDEILSLLPCSSAPMESGWKPIIEALPVEERKLLKDGKTSQVGKNLLRGAIKYNQLRFFDFLMSCGFVFAQPDFMELLSVATEAGQTSTIKKLLGSHKSLPLTCAPNLDTPLHRASAHGFSEITQLLLARGASVLAKGSSQDTPVHVAANNGHLEVLQLLVKENSKTALIEVPSARSDYQGSADDTRERASESPEPSDTNDALEIENDSNSIPLEVAIRSGNEAIVSLLLRNTQRTTVLKRELLHIASRRENLDVLQLLLNDQEIEPNRKSGNEWYALEIACSVGSFDVAQMLIEHGAEAWPPDIETRDYPFARLAYIDDKTNAARIAKLLMSQPRPATSVLSSMLVYVADAATEMLIATLLDAGADKNATDSYKRTALHICAVNDNEAGLRMLLMRGADSSTVDIIGYSPLADATARAYLNIMQLLLERGERLSLDIAEGVLSRMTSRGMDETVEALKAILESQEELRGTKALNECFRVALRRNDSRLVSLLLDYGASNSYKSPRLRARYGSALHECAYYGNVKMARLLLDQPSEFSGSMVNNLAGQYYTPLIAAVSWDHQKLSEHSKKDELTKRRLLKQTKMVEFLISRGGKKLLMGGRYGTMLSAAVAMGEPKLVTYIVSKVGFDKTEVDDQGRNAAHIGSSMLNKRDNIGTLKLLPDELLWTKDKHGRLPLHFACGGQRLKVLQDLLVRDISEDKINQADDDGWTPLHWACRQWDISILRFLIKCGAKRDSRTLEQWTPWDVAVFHDNSDFAAALHRSDSDTEANDLVEKEGKRWSASCDSCLVSGERVCFETILCSRLTEGH